MRPTLKIDLSNKFKNELWIGNHLISSGNRGLENVELRNLGKRTVVVLTLTNVNVIVGASSCPETHRYGKILAAFGNHSKLSKLGLVCDLLKVSPHACDGCSMVPRGFTVPAHRRPVAGLTDRDKAPA